MSGFCHFFCDFRKRANAFPLLECQIIEGIWRTEITGVPDMHTVGNSVLYSYAKLQYIFLYN